MAPQPDTATLLQWRHECDGSAGNLQVLGDLLAKAASLYGAAGRREFALILLQGARYASFLSKLALFADLALIAWEAYGHEYGGSIWDYFDDDIGYSLAVDETGNLIFTQSGT